MRTLRQDWEEQLERITKQHRRTAQAARRLEELMEADEGSEGNEGEGEDVHAGNAQSGQPSGVHPMRQRMDFGPWLGGRTG